ncbi:MAG: hypothetical protein KAT61_07125, partial [Gammaproteobacteria bacterium]|nr:hypothetical protein [Gammaproteobacteria bacterium]
MIFPIFNTNNAVTLPEQVFMVSAFLMWVWFCFCALQYAGKLSRFALWPRVDSILSSSFEAGTTTGLTAN